MDYIELASAPYEEKCACVGEEDYAERSTKECKAFINQLNRQHPVPEALGGDCWYSIKSAHHDFGTYREVVINYADNDEARKFAMSAEDFECDRWDDEARLELGLDSILRNRIDSGIPI